MTENIIDYDDDIFAPDSESEQDEPAVARMCNINIESPHNSSPVPLTDEQSLPFVIDRGGGEPDDHIHHMSDNKKESSYSEHSDTETLNNKQFHKPKAKTQNLKDKANGFGLSSSLQDGLDTDVYVSMDYISTKPGTSQTSQRKIDKLIEKSVLPVDAEKLHCLPPYQVSLHQTQKLRQKERSQTKGKSWYNMRAPEMTEEKKNDLSVLQMRRTLDPKRFYKNQDIRALPKFFQMGKVIEDATDFYSARVPKKQRKRTLVDELLEDAEFRRYNKKKYTELVQKNQKHSKSGAAKHMKRLKKKKK